MTEKPSYTYFAAEIDRGSDSEDIFYSMYEFAQDIFNEAGLEERGYELGVIDESEIEEDPEYAYFKENDYNCVVIFKEA